MRKALIAVAFATSALIGSQAAYAAIATNVSIRYNMSTERFHGEVRSSDSDCEANRLVKVFKKTASGRALQGRDRSSATGVWRVPVMHAQGHYFAVAPKQQGMHGVCARDRSKTYDVM